MPGEPELPWGANREPGGAACKFPLHPPAGRRVTAQLRPLGDTALSLPPGPRDTCASSPRPRQRPSPAARAAVRDTLTRAQTAPKVVRTPQSSPLLKRRTPPRLRRARLRDPRATEAGAAAVREGGQIQREPGSRPSAPSRRPARPLREEETSPTPTFGRKEAAPPAAPAAAAALHAQRQQERHPAQPPGQHPRRRSRLRAAAAAYCPRRLSPPAVPAPRAPLCVRRVRLGVVAVPVAAALGLRCPPPRRALASSSRAHWRGPGAAPALTPGRPVTSRREGGGSCIFMRRGHRRRAPRCAPGCCRPQLSSPHRQAEHSAALAPQSGAGSQRSLVGGFREPSGQVSPLPLSNGCCKDDGLP